MNLIQFPTALAAVDSADQASVTRAAQIKMTVKQVQQRLLALGFKLPKYGADGAYGQETKDALIAFQTAVGITADGGISQETLQWLTTVKKEDLFPVAQAFNQGVVPTQVPKAVIAPPTAIDKVKATLFPAAEPFYLRPGWYIIGGLGLILAVVIAKVAAKKPS